MESAPQSLRNDASLSSSIYERILLEKKKQLSSKEIGLNNKQVNNFEVKRQLLKAFNSRHQKELRNIQRKGCKSIYQSRPSKQNILVIFAEKGQKDYKRNSLLYRHKGGLTVLPKKSLQKCKQLGINMKKERLQYVKMLDMNIIERNEWWDCIRKQKIANQSSKTKQLELGQCTFRPIINRTNSTKHCNHTPITKSYFQLKQNKSLKLFKKPNQ